VKVRISRRASADLEEIADWIALDNPAKADSFVRALLKRSLSLGQHPRRFPHVGAISGEPIYKLGWRGYVLLYRVSPDGVEIARILHGRRIGPACSKNPDRR
jgi:plasmid stabilization system protein ParE